MRDQIHIRDAETVTLVRALARQTGRPMAAIVREAVQAWRPVPAEAAGVRSSSLARALERDRATLRRGAFELDELYGEDGLPK